jgi:hypothetical protein
MATAVKIGVKWGKESLEVEVDTAQTGLGRADTFAKSLPKLCRQNTG